MFKKICVIGMGYIGLPTASTFAIHGVQVLGVDVDRRVLEALHSGRVHIQEPGLRALAEQAFASGNLKVSEEPEPADAFIIAVPTPATEPASAGADPQAELGYVIAAAKTILPHLRTGNLVMLESTCPPRTTLDLVGPILEGTGLRAGVDFLLAYSPERVLPGRILQELTENARVIGGVNRASAEAGRELYGLFVRGEIVLTDATTAEMVKLMENTSRDVDIALANEFARLAEDLGVDVWEAIALANRHPRINILRPGPGVGGHCVSVDPWFLVQADPGRAQLIRTARRLNDEQPEFAVRLVERALGGLPGRAVAGLGLAYKPDVDDLRESPALEVVRLLAQRGAQVRTYEPYVPERTAPGALAVGSLSEALNEAQAVVLLVDHRAFRELDPAQVAADMPGRVAVDLRGVWQPAQWHAAGFSLHTLGVGTRRG
jgi:UDP-N-acetyl-D-mannosaminuronic acid dehydrogenase